MKGDQGGISRGEKLFLRVSQGDKFKKEVAEIRKEYLISDFGFSYKEYIGDWYSGTHLIPVHRERFEKFKNRIDILLRHHAFPLNSWWRYRVISFVIAGDKMDFLSKLHDFQQPFVELVNHHVGRDGSYNDIRIYEGSDIRDVRDFIQNNWKRVKPSYREGTSQKIRGQKKEDIEINADAVAFIEIPAQSFKKKGRIKEAIIAEELHKTHGKRVSVDAVKARAYRTKNKKR